MDERANFNPRFGRKENKIKKHDLKGKNSDNVSKSRHFRRLRHRYVKLPGMSTLDKIEFRNLVAKFKAQGKITAPSEPEQPF